MQEPDAPITDGRTLRALRTRDAIVDATIALVEEGDLRPTAPRVAERAGVSVRSIFQHFTDLESLHAAVAERLAERLMALVVPILPEGPFEERLQRFVHQRGMLLEVLTPLRRAADVHGPFSEEITARMRDGQDFLRREIQVTFAPELHASGEDHDEVLDALDVVLGWGTWYELRARAGRDQDDAEVVVRRMVRAVLAAADRDAAPAG